MRPLLVAALLLAPLPLAAAGHDLAGRVVDAAGKPIPNAHVWIYEAFPRVGRPTICPSCYRDCRKREAVGARGEFRVKSLDPKLVFRVLAVADGFEPAFAERVAPEKGPLTITLHRREIGDGRLIVRGRVVDAKGNPVIGAAAHFHALRLGNRTGYGKIAGVDPLSITNMEGEFALKVPQDDALVDVRVVARNLAPKIERKLMPGLDPATITMSPGAAVTGRVERDGKPLANARVTLMQKSRLSANWLGTQELATGEDGRFLLLGVAPNEVYELRVYGDETAFETKELRVGGDGATIDAGTLTPPRPSR